MRYLVSVEKGSSAVANAVLGVIGDDLPTAAVAGVLLCEAGEFAGALPHLERSRDCPGWDEGCQAAVIAALWKTGRREDAQMLYRLVPPESYGYPAHTTAPVCDRLIESEIVPAISAGKEN